MANTDAVDHPTDAERYTCRQLEELHDMYQWRLDANGYMQQEAYVPPVVPVPVQSDKVFTDYDYGDLLEPVKSAPVVQEELQAHMPVQHQEESLNSDITVQTPEQAESVQHWHTWVFRQSYTVAWPVLAVFLVLLLTLATVAILR